MSKTAKFEIGDKVKVMYVESNWWNYTSQHDKMLEKEYVIIDILSHGNIQYLVDLGDTDNVWVAESWLELVPKNDKEPTYQDVIDYLTEIKLLATINVLNDKFKPKKKVSKAQVVYKSVSGDFKLSNCYYESKEQFEEQISNVEFVEFLEVSRKDMEE